MNKKGFTLIELVAAITILGILTVLIAPNVMEMRKSVLTKSLNSRIDMIETAAIDYATKEIYNKISTECTKKTVNNLIENGYLVGTNADKTSIDNPLSGQSLNGLFVCIKFDSTDVMTRKVVACVEGYSCQE